MSNLPARGDLQAAREFLEHLRQDTLRSNQERRRNRGGRGSFSGHGGHEGHSSRGGSTADNQRQIPVNNIEPVPVPVPCPIQHGNSFCPSINASSTVASAEGEPMDIDTEPPSPKRTLFNSPWAGTLTSHVAAPRPVIKQASQASHSKRTTSPKRGLADSPWATSTGSQERSVVQEPERVLSSDVSEIYHDNDWQYTYSLEDHTRSYSQAANNARAAGDPGAEAKLRQVANLCSHVIHARLKLHDQQAEREASAAASKAIQLAQPLHDKYARKTLKTSKPSRGQSQELLVHSRVSGGAHHPGNTENEPLQVSHSTVHSPAGAGPPRAQTSLARHDNARKLFLEHWRLNSAM